VKEPSVTEVYYNWSHLVKIHVNKMVWQMTWW